MKTHRALRKLSLWAAAGALILAGACSTDSPSEPDRSPGPAPGTGGGGGATYTVTVTAQPSVVPVASPDPVLVTVVARQAGGGNPPNGTIAVVSTLLGSFGSPDGQSTVNLQLTSGRAQVTYFAPAAVGEGTNSVVVNASVAGSVGRTTIRFAEEDVFFVGSVQPSTGSPQGGDVVDILGSGFDGPVRVSFGSATAQVLSVSANRIRVRTPRSPGPGNEVTTVPVTVTINVNQEDEATDVLAGGFTYAPGGDVQQPVVLSVTPATGPNEGGTRVRITGSGFSSPVQVEFGSGGTFVEAQIESVSPTEIVVRSPAATGFGQSLRNTNVDIRIRNLDSGLQATSTQSFRYGTEVLITSASPTIGPYFGGQIVTIFGQGFNAPVAIELANFAQNSLTVTGTELTLRTAAIRTATCSDPTGPIEVVNINSGDGASALSYIYEVVRYTPVIFTVSPDSGDEDGGTVVTLSGRDLRTPLASIGGRPAEVLSTSADATTMTIRTPFLPLDEFNVEACDDNSDGTAGERYVPTSKDVQVVNADTTCSVTFTKGFTYIPDNRTCRNDVGPAPPPPPVQCEDGFDNDSDGLIDAADPQCTGPGDDDESA